MQFMCILDRILRKPQREKTLGFGVVSELLGWRHSESLALAVASDGVHSPHYNAA
jgi:hypothetical protein